MTGDLLVQPATTPQIALATDRVLADRARATGRLALRVWTLAGDALALGRYHLAPPGGGDVLVWRRQSGGRVAPAGEGFVGVSLVLPHRSALAGDDPLALAPAQVPNRCVRGILGAWERAGVAARYPGRDTVTVGGRIAGVVSFEVDAAGACVFEALLAVGRDASLLPHLLERADPAGVVQAAMVFPEHATSLARERGEEPALAQVVAWLREGYATRLELGLEPRELTAGEGVAVAALVEGALADARWLHARRPRRDLARRGAVATQLGTLEAHCALAAGRLAGVVLAGDVLADSSGFVALETALRGRTPGRTEIAEVVGAHLADPHHFLLGLGADPAGVVAEAVARAAGV